MVKRNQVVPKFSSLEEQCCAQILLISTSNGPILYIIQFSAEHLKLIFQVYKNYTCLSLDYEYKVLLSNNFKRLFSFGSSLDLASIFRLKFFIFVFLFFIFTFFLSLFLFQFFTAKINSQSQKKIPLTNYFYILQISS